MTTPVDVQTVESAMIRARLQWLLDYWGEQKASCLDDLARNLSEFIEEYERRFGERPDPFGLLDDHPEKGLAFFQFDTLLASLDAKIVIWRILLGCEIKELDLHYDKQDGVRLRIQLATPYGQIEEYESGHWADFRVLRHFGTMSVGNQLRLQGYYAAKA